MTAPLRRSRFSVQSRKFNMRLDHLFFVYMAAVGAAAAGILIAAPKAGDFIIKPYFWVLLAVAVFDLATYLFTRGKPGKMLGMDGRLLGFVIGIVVMVVIKVASGSTASVF
jgi:hypothetical protein